MPALRPAPPATAPANEMFLRNMRALWLEDPVLALRVDAVNDDERVAVEPARRGAWTASVPAPGGQAVQLHSRYDPCREAEQFVGAISLEEKYCFVVCGLGLGYHVRALADRLRGEAVIICSEPSVPLIASALCCVDLSDLITGRRLIILTDPDKTRLHERLQPHTALIMLGAQFVQHPPSMRAAEAAHRAVCDALAEFLTYTRMTIMTLVHNSEITCRNIAMNLPAYVSTPPVDLLRRRFAGDPAVVISAGPSLRRNIEVLAGLKGRAVLCAVQTAIRPLMQRGIVPDFVTSLDYHEMSRKFFEDVGDLSGVHLVAEPKATWHVIDHYPGPVSLLDNEWARLVVGDELGTRGGLPAGATVAHLAFYLAVYMGCDPIIFVGQDLAYTGHVYYVPGVEIHRAWWSELNRFHTLELKEWDRIVRGRPILRKVVGNDGEELFTDELLFTYLEQFEKDIAAAPCRVINATQGGARIRGTQVMTLQQAADRFCGRSIDPARFAYRAETRWHDAVNLPAARAQLERRLAELDDAAAVCDEIIELLGELANLTHDPPRFNQRLIRVDELRTRVYQDTRAYRIVNAATQLAELRRFSADRQIEAVAVEGAERARRQIARDIAFITGVRQGVARVRPMLAAALERVIAAGECHDAARSG